MQAYQTSRPVDQGEYMYGTVRDNPWSAAPTCPLWTLLLPLSWLEDSLPVDFRTRVCLGPEHANSYESYAEGRPTKRVNIGVGRPSS